MPRTKRKDKSRVVLRTGESQRADGTYHFSWTDANHKRRYVYAKTLDELRYKEEQIAKDKSDGIKAEARYTTVNDIYELWKDLKRGLKNNTFENYKYMYETFVRHQIGSKTVSSLRKTDIKRFYNYLADERHLKPATIDNIHTVLHQILDMAVDDDYIRNTSNIDIESENDIMDEIHELAKARTVILISHRLANVTESDCIYVMNSGSIVQSGSHETLLASGGVYAELWNAQQELENYGKDGEQL